MTLPEFFTAEQEGTVPGQEDLRRGDDSGRTRFILAVAEADLRISLCESQVRFAPWISECETYTVDHNNGRYCLPCAEAKASYEQSEAE